MGYLQLLALILFFPLRDSHSCAKLRTVVLVSSSSCIVRVSNCTSCVLYRASFNSRRWNSIAMASV